ncbi:MAG: hypothetical protein EBV73_08165, partial [Rhodocyclales bacterium]|nr:hypothetical protein [Rhodocyclales bacterium]
MALLRQFLSRSSGLFKVPLEGLRALFSKKWFRRGVAGVIAGVVGLWMLAACLLQFWLFPNINDYRDRLATEVGSALGMQVAVGQLTADWSHLHPRFTLNDVVVFDRTQQPAVRLSQVKAEIAWLPLLTGSLGFRSLLVETPDLDVRRDTHGALFLSGLPLGGGGDFRVDALLEQGDLRLVSQEVRWTDAMRKAPTLVLTDVNMHLRSRSGKHRLEVLFAPPKHMGTPVQLKAGWYGRSFDDWQSWPIDVSLKIQSLDMAPWVAWVDYPVPIQSGRIKADLNLSLQGRQLSQLTGDVALTELKAQLGDGLKPLMLKQLSSDIAYKHGNSGLSTQLALDAFSWTD